MPALDYENVLKAITSLASSQGLVFAYGLRSITFTNDNSVTVSVSHGMPAAPLIVITDNHTGINVFSQAHSYGASTFSIYAAHRDGGSTISTSWDIAWFAIGFEPEA